MHSQYKKLTLVSTLQQKWRICFKIGKYAREKVHVVVSDNVSNMIRAMSDASCTHFGCFAHSIQLVIKDGLFVQRALNDIIAVC